MELEGTQALDASAQTVWTALFDRDVLAGAIPGCESLEQTSETSFVAVVKLKIGPVSARFKGDVELSDIDPLRACTLSGKGTGGIAGFAKGRARVVLDPQADETILTYTVEATVGGKLAALGSRLIKSTAKKLAGEFFAKFQQILAEQNATESAVEAAE